MFLWGLRQSCSWYLNLSHRIIRHVFHMHEKRFCVFFSFSFWDLSSLCCLRPSCGTKRRTTICKNLNFCHNQQVLALFYVVSHGTGPFRKKEKKKMNENAHGRLFSFISFTGEETPTTLFLLFLFSSSIFVGGGQTWQMNLNYVRASKPPHQKKKKKPSKKTPPPFPDLHLHLQRHATITTNQSIINRKTRDPFLTPHLSLSLSLSNSPFSFLAFLS